MGAKDYRNVIKLDTVGDIQKDDNAGTSYGLFTGYANVYGIKDLHEEIVDAGAFKQTLTVKASYPLLWNHNADEPIGLISLSDTAKGLYADGQINLGTSRGRDVYALFKQGAVDGLSIGGWVEDFYYDTDGVYHARTINLREVSATPFPANTESLVDSVKNDKPTPDEIVQAREYIHFVETQKLLKINDAMLAMVNEFKHTAIETSKQNNKQKDN